MSEVRIDNLIGMAKAEIQKDLLRSNRRLNRLHLALLKEGIPHSINYGVEDAANTLSLRWADDDRDKQPLIYAPSYEMFWEKYRLKIRGEETRKLTFKDAVEYAKRIWDEHEAK